MNYYERHLGDYIKDTVSLSMLEEGAYNRLLDAYYVKESPLPPEKEKCYRIARAKSKAERLAVDTVLQEFFVLTEEGFRKNRCDEEIEKYQARAPKAEEKKENDKERQRRARERRQALFNALSEQNVHMPWNATTAELEHEIAKLNMQPVTPPVTKPVTRDNTATRHQTPDTNIKPSVNDTLPKTPDPPGASSQTPGQKLNGYGPIATELIELGIQVTSIHPTLQAWVDEGITIERLRECVAVARQSKPSPEKIPANYLDRIVREPPREAKAPKPKEPQWWASEKGIEAKGRELGLRPKGGESWNDFKARINEKLKGNGNG